MDSIPLRYGETVVLPIDAGDPSAVTADIYVGKPGSMYIIHQTINLTDGQGTFVLDSESTKVPIGVYYYQINTTDDNGHVSKFPSPDGDDCGDCEDEFPEFIVSEALDEIEVS